MPWKDSNPEMVLEEIEPIDEPLPASKKIEWGVAGYAVLGVGILVLSGVILYLFLGQSMSEDSEQIRVLSERMAAIENRLGVLETSSQADDAMAKRTQRVALFMNRFENLEATMARRMSDLSQRVEALESGGRSKRTAPPPVASTPPPAAASPPASKTAGVTAKAHVVAKGDTLYSISRKYGLSVDELLKLNGMSKGAVIYPGQSLRVAGAK